jgi:hypothetical protein
MAFFHELIRQLDRFIACELSSLDGPTTRRDPGHGEEAAVTLSLSAGR